MYNYVIAYPMFSEVIKGADILVDFKILMYQKLSKLNNGLFHAYTHLLLIRKKYKDFA